MSHLDFTALLSFILLVIVAAITAHYARLKGRNPFLWFIIGLLFGIFAPLFLLFLKPKQEEEETKSPGMTELTPDPSLSQQREIPLPLDVPPVVQKEENKLWYYLDDKHEQIGPVSLIALRELWKRGLLQLNQYVWSDGMTEWKTVDELPDLKEALSRKEDITPK